MFSQEEDRVRDLKERIIDLLKEHTTNTFVSLNVTLTMAREAMEMQKRIAAAFDNKREGSPQDIPRSPGI